MRSRTQTKAAAGIAVLALFGAGLAGCSSTSNSAVGGGDPASIEINQYGVGAAPGDVPKVYTPFYVTGTKFTVNAGVTLAVVPKGGGAALFSTTATSTAGGLISIQVPSNAKFVAGTSYTVNVSYTGGAVVGSKNFQNLGANTRPTGTAHVTGTGVPSSLSYPILQGTNVLISHSADGGSIYNWPISSLPTAPGAPVAVAPASSWQPAVPGGVKMEQINFDNNGQNLLIAKKAINVNTTGGNSVWSYPWTGSATSGNGSQLMGNEAPAGNGFYTWGPGSGLQPNSNATVANTYTSAHFPTTAPATPRTVSMGDGGGAIQAANGNYYFGSLQSGCVYKETPDLSWATTVYCIPSWGTYGLNAATYSLAEDVNGNVYAMYQGTDDFNTMILKITPAAAQGADTVQALQLTGYARSVGLAVSADGSKIFADAVPVAQFNDNNTNSILQITNPVWGTAAAPTATKPAAVLTLPGTADQVWLTGMTYYQANNELVIADNKTGFYVDFL